MFSATSVLVLACAVTLIGAHPPPPPAYCTTAQIGVTSNHPANLAPKPLRAYVKDFDVYIPDVPECIYSGVGASALVCDFDAPPTAYFTDLHNFQVTRTGTTAGAGLVTVTVYCNDFPST